MKPFVTVLAAASSGLGRVVLVLGFVVGAGCDSNPTPHPERDARTPDSTGGMHEPGRGDDGDPAEYDPDSDFSNGADASPESLDSADQGADAADGGDGRDGDTAADPSNGASDAGPCPSVPESGGDQVESQRRGRAWWWRGRD